MKKQLKAVNEWNSLCPSTYFNRGKKESLISLICYALTCFLPLWKFKSHISADIDVLKEDKFKFKFSKK